jgi:hypothetical protein
MDVDLCASLERWEFPVIDGLRLDVRLSQVRATSPSAASSSDTCQQRRNVIHESGCLLSSPPLCAAAAAEDAILWD